MNNFPIQCFVCDPPLTIKGDSAYLQHMQTVHSQEKQLIDKNIPKDTPVIHLDKDTPPSAEFAELAKIMDSNQSSPSPLSVESEVKTSDQTDQTLQREKKDLLLKYRWEGNCPTCNTPVRTIMVNVDDKEVAIAYCLTHEQVKEREVYPLDVPTIAVAKIGSEIKTIKNDAVIEEQIAKRKVGVKKYE